eukprot:TRINITY_DN7523_c0_g2_i1.p1 TRINITY_DN7523_c0_g2~~TRINITY_DN7523_c0_g2_i1.p1  ORF type:complete len:310 (+),score=25.43 TRINITY_DN7523_c0_g2_i1:151-1080(+)
MTPLNAATAQWQSCCSAVKTAIDGINANASVQSNISKIDIKVKDLAPSGPRAGTEGTDDLQQEIAYAQQTPQGDVILLITLLAAGFVVGSKGSSVQKVCERSGCSIKSWNARVPIHSQQKPKAVRVFLIQGSQFGILEAIRLVVAAVNRYKLLIDGAYKDQVVPPIQTVEGIQFVYKPPPIHAMPWSARTISFKDYERQLQKQREASRCRGLMACPPPPCPPTTCGSYGAAFLPVAGTPLFQVEAGQMMSPRCTLDMGMCSSNNSFSSQGIPPYAPPPQYMCNPPPPMYPMPYFPSSKVLPAPYQPYSP